MIRHWVNEAKSEWGRNPRLRAGLLVIVVLLAVYEISGLSIFRQQLAMDYAEKLAELSRIKAISREDSWDRRAAAAKELREALQAEVPSADSVGLAQATYQGLLRDVVSGFGPRMNIAMDTPQQVEGLPGYWKCPAQITGPITVDDALQLIRQVESRKDLLSIEALQLTTGDDAYLNVTLVAFYRVNAPGAPDVAP